MAGAEEAAAEALPATPAYAAPEAFSTKPLTEAADVFSLAATLYAVLAGYPPRNVGVPLVTSEEMVRLAERPIEPLPGVNRHLMDALLAALTNDPSARPTAAGFREQLAIRRNAATSGVAGMLPVGDPDQPSIPTATAVDSQRAPSQAIHPTTQAKKPGRTCCRRNDNGDRHHGSGNGLVGQRARPVAFTGGDHAECGAHGPEHQQPTKPQSSPGAGHSRGKGRLTPQNPSKPFEFEVPTAAEKTALCDCSAGRKQVAGIPLPTRTDRSGQFTAYVEFGQPGRYRLRLLDPDTGVMSKTFVLRSRADRSPQSARCSGTAFAVLGLRRANPRH